MNHICWGIFLKTHLRLNPCRCLSGELILEEVHVRECYLRLLRLLLQLLPQQLQLVVGTQPQKLASINIL
jgi:hypothetical protein